MAKRAPLVYNDGSGATTHEINLEYPRNNGPKDPFAVHSTAYQIHVTPVPPDGYPENGSDGGNARE
jgi:hypothetical protein